MLAAFAAPPLWWSIGNPPVIDPAAAVNNKGPANIGQAKHMAQSALAALRPILPTVASQIEADLTAGTNPILSFTIPDPKTPEWIEKQKAPLLIGQLKAIAAPFYTRLHAAAPTWLEAERTANSTNHPNSIFPWTSETTDDQNKAIANIGQLKAVFSLRFETIASATDSDQDGLLDLWELRSFSSLNQSANDDFDGDTFSNLVEFYQASDPSLIADIPKGMLASGSIHSLALTADGRVWAWGYNGYGQLGDGTFTYRSAPIPVPIVDQMAKIVSIDSAGNVSMALDANGILWAWGNNSSRQISIDDISSFKTPVKIPLPAPIIRFACGANHCLAFDRNGKIWAWGSNSYGQLGVGHTSSVVGFTEVTKPATVGQIAFLEGSEYSSYLIDAHGKAWAWGYNGDGQLGDASDSSRNSPVAIDATTGVTKLQTIVSSNSHVLAQASDGALWSWGSNGYGQLGSVNTTSSNKPLKNTTLSQTKALSAGESHSLAVAANGQVWSWGNNGSGQLGLNTTTSANIPTLTAAVSDWASLNKIACGSYHSIALKFDGSIWTWGYNGYGQLGHGDTTQRNIATKLAKLKLANDDSDADTLADSWEQFYYGSLTKIGSDIGISGGVSNSVAYSRGLNPLLMDNDNDGISDVVEISNGFNPSNDEDALEDKDGDRIPNIFELKRGTLPNNPNSKPAATFIVNPATGGSTTTDNIYPTIKAAITQANRYVYDSSTQQYGYPDRHAIIEVKAGTYAEQVLISTVPVLLLGELGAASGPVTITGRSDYDDAVVYLSSSSVIDGFIITHSLGRKGLGVHISTDSSTESNRRRIVNCIIRGNEYGNGGGIYNSGSLLDLVHCTITGNKSEYQGKGIYTSGGKLNLINSIVWGNSGAATQEISNQGSLLNVTTSIIADPSPIGYTDWIYENPQLTPVGWLESTSPAINRVGAVLSSASRVDIHGEIRPSGSAPDLGADEFISSDGDNLPDFWELQYFGNLTKGYNDDNDVPTGDGLRN